MRFVAIATARRGTLTAPERLSEDCEAAVLAGLRREQDAAAARGEEAASPMWRSPKRPVQPAGRERVQRMLALAAGRRA